MVGRIDAPAGTHLLSVEKDFGRSFQAFYGDGGIELSLSLISSRIGIAAA
jgi:hypothetical protein